MKSCRKLFRIGLNKIVSYRGLFKQHNKIESCRLNFRKIIKTIIKKEKKNYV